MCKAYVSGNLLPIDTALTMVHLRTKPHGFRDRLHFCRSQGRVGSGDVVRILQCQKMPRCQTKTPHFWKGYIQAFKLLCLDMFWYFFLIESNGWFMLRAICQFNSWSLILPSSLCPCLMFILKSRSFLIGQLPFVLMMIHEKSQTCLLGQLLNYNFRFVLVSATLCIGWIIIPDPNVCVISYWI